MFYYNIYNFTIESDFEIDACECEMDPQRLLDHTHHLKYRKLTPKKREELFQCKEWSYLTLKFYPLIAYETDKYIILRYLDLYFVAISLNTNEIYVDVESVDSKMSINVAVGGGLSIYMYLSNYIPLHAMTVEYSSTPFAFLAPSRTGKSTLQHYLIQYGCQSITDDVLPVRVVNEDVICYSSKNLKVKIDSNLAFRFNLSLEDESIVTPLENKYWLSLDANSRSKKDHTLKHLFYLNPQSSCSNVTIKELSKLETLKTIIENCHFIQFAPSKYRDKILKSISNTFKNVSLYEVNYEKKFETIPDIIQTVLDFVCKN